MSSLLAGASSTIDATPSATASTSSAPPQVSEKTTCDLLFARPQSKPLNKLVNFMTSKSVTVQEITGADKAIAEMREIATSASAHLAAQLDAFADYAEKFLAAVRANDQSPLDDTAAQAAAREITNTCQPLE